ncbi:MAG: ferrochelatase, partial [Acidobacteria bacterium]|nr:ferrochelatase [Acidobacteriota bacterium]
MTTAEGANNGAAVLLIAFGGPETPEDILPFLRRATQGHPVPEERLQEVAGHYRKIGGKSPLNELTFRQAAALRAELADLGRPLPVYVGMRNWHPLLAETLKKMHSEGVRRAAGLILAPHQSDSSWEKYRRSVTEALAEGALSLEVVFGDPLFDHPGFLEAVAGAVSDCLRRLPPGERADAVLLFTAHSIPARDPLQSLYVQQLNQSCRGVAAAVQHNRWQLSYQSRSGRPRDPGLEPDVT